MSECRQGSEGFSVASYYNLWPDLRRAFGADWASYYRHYLDCGYAEGRSATGADGVDAIVSPTSVLGGVDYSPVYDGAYYLRNNPDLEAAFAVSNARISVIDDSMLLTHFVVCGMSECRQGSEGFSVASYYNEYPDLRRAFGSNWVEYYRHYIEYGMMENRHGVGHESDYVQDTTSIIMGQSNTTTEQMVRRYNAVSRFYPSSVYAQYGAPTIDDFCRILYEEANAEGVRAEIVFAQSMHETAWLQFGGDVCAEQCNFAGLGATGGINGASFNDWGDESVRKGLRAQVQHLKAYASTEPLVNDCVDPRFHLVSRGIAPTVEDLAGKWAVPGIGYAEAIMTQIHSLYSA